jgi:hypothetical protein
MTDLIFEAEVGKLSADVGSDSWFFGIEVTICIEWVGVEVCFIRPTF